jgi:arsenite-transporting ATPase
MQQRYVAEIKEKFGDYVVATLPMFEREPKGLEMIRRASVELMNSSARI